MGLLLCDNSRRVGDIDKNFGRFKFYMKSDILLIVLLVSYENNYNVFKVWSVGCWMLLFYSIFYIFRERDLCKKEREMLWGRMVRMNLMILLGII